MHYTSRDIARPEEVLPWLGDLPEDLAPWLDEAGLPDGLPFLLSPRYEYDVVLNSYFHRVNLIDAPWNSNANRARALAAFLNFLHGARGGKSWRQASESDHLAFHQWRRRDPAGPRVAGGTWSQEVSHVNQFFEWAVRQHQIGAIPIPHRSRRPAPPGTLQAARAGSTVPATREQAVPLAARPGGEDGRGPRRTARPGPLWVSCLSWPYPLVRGEPAQAGHRQPSSSGHSRTLRCAASSISCASMPARVSAIPYIGHWQTNSSGPLGGNGHAHQRKNCECVVPPPPRGRRIGSVGSDSPCAVPLTTLVPSESSKLKTGADSGSACLRRIISGVGSWPTPGMSGRMHRAMKISNPVV